MPRYILWRMVSPENLPKMTEKYIEQVALERIKELEAEVERLQAVHAEDVLHYHVAVGQRDEAKREIEQLRTEVCRLKEALFDLTRERDEYRSQRNAVIRERDKYVSAVKEYFDAIVNHGLARERVRAANDRADHLYSAWKHEPTEELSQRRKENMTQCLMAADAASKALHREEMAREALGALLTTTAVGSSGDAALGGEVRGE